MDDPYDVIYSDPLCSNARDGKVCPQVVVAPSAWEPAGRIGEPGGRWGRLRALVLVNGSPVYLVAVRCGDGAPPTSGRLHLRRHTYVLSGVEPA